MKSLFLFQGRISRSRFWINSIIGLILPTVIMSLLSFFGILVATPGVGGSPGIGILVWFFILISSLAVLVAGLVIYWSAMVRRFHDRDKSGWWSLICLIPFIGGIWILVECGCLKGTDGPNQYGDDPLTLQDTSSPVVAPAQ